MNLPVNITNSNSYSEVAKEIWQKGRALIGGFDRVVFTNGCFDILHPGHLQLLQYARNLASPRGALVVGINSDESIKRLKGDDRPIMSENARALLLISLRMVDFAVVFDEDTPLKLIEAIRPDVIVKGGDYNQSDVVGGHLALVSIAPYDQSWSTTEIIRRIKNNG